MSPKARHHCLVALIASAAVLGGTAHAQHRIEGQPYGQPSECLPGGPAALGLYLAHGDGRTSALRLEGGTPGAPAALLFAAEAAETAVPGGGTVLVGAVVGVATGQFGSDGVFTHPLGALRFTAGATLFAQGMQPMSGLAGAELSGGLRLERKQVDCAPPPATAPNAIAPQLPEEIFAEEFGGLLRAGYLEAALDLALNSKDDALALELNGKLELPIYPGVTAGGKAAFKATVKRGEDQQGSVVYDLVIGADVAASAGVGAGVAGAGISAGVGGEVVWRYDSTHEVARAVRSMAILQAVGPRLEDVCLALDTHLDRIDRAIDWARGTADGVRRFVRSRMPWRNIPLVVKVQQARDAMRAKRREIADRARRAVEQLVGWVAAERIFLIEHELGYEVHGNAAIEGSLSTPGFGNAEQGGEFGLANVGASIGATVEQQLGLRVERVPESKALAYELKAVFTKSIAGAAGAGIGVAAAGKRVIEIGRRIQVGTDGVPQEDSGATVKLILDGKLLGAVGVVVVGQYGVGGEVVIEMRLADLLRYGSDAVAVLLSDDTDEAAALLRTLPVELRARGRYEAGIAVGIGLEIKGAFKGGIGASAMMIDWTDGAENQGSTDTDAVAKVLCAGPLRDGDAGIAAKLGAVRDEVTRVMRN